MWTPTSRIAVTAFLFLITLLSGVSLSRSLRLNDPRPYGKPVSNGMFSVHKFGAILTVIVAAVTIRKLQSAVGMGGVEVALVIVAGLLFLLMFVSGAFLSIGRARNDEILTLHKVASLMIAIPAALAIYLLLRSRS